MSPFDALKGIGRVGSGLIGGAFKLGGGLIKGTAGLVGKGVSSVVGLFSPGAQQWLELLWFRGKACERAGNRHP